MTSSSTTLSSPVLWPPTGSPERSFREQNQCFRIVFNHEGLEEVSDDKHKPIHKLDRAFQLLDF